MARGAKDADASFVDGMLLGLVAGAALVLLLTPRVRAQVFQMAQQFGPTDGAARADQARDVVLAAVAPPADPLSAQVVPPATDL